MADKIDECNSLFFHPCCKREPSLQYAVEWRLVLCIIYDVRPSKEATWFLQYLFLLEAAVSRNGLRNGTEQTPFSPRSLRPLKFV